MTIEQRVNEANQKVMDILLNGRPVWKDVRPALEAIPGMTRESILVAGPPACCKNHAAHPHVHLRRCRT